MMANFQAGSRVPFRGKKIFSPYVQTLFGGVSVNTHRIRNPFPRDSALQPGTYRIGVTATGLEYLSGSAQATITLQDNPSGIYAGEKPALAAKFEGQRRRQVQAPVQFESFARTQQRKPLALAASASDNRQVRIASTRVMIPKACPTPVRLPDILFLTDRGCVNIAASGRCWSDRGHIPNVIASLGCPGMSFHG
jgi:hypothetical protein